MNLVVLQNLLDNASFAVLLIAMLLYWVGAAFKGIPYLSTLGTTGMAIANLCMATLLGSRWLEAGYFPLSNLYESLFFLAWGITTIHLIAENRSRSPLVGLVTAPVAMGITAFAALTLPLPMQMAEPLVPALKSNWLMMHVSVMMLSYAALMVGSLLAIAFLIVTRGQNIQLQGSSVGTGGYRLQRADVTQYKDDSSDLSVAQASSPALELVGVGNMPTPQNQGNVQHRLIESNNGGRSAVFNSVLTTPVKNSQLLSPQRLSLAETLDNISYRVIGLGFPLLTVGIIAGAVWANEAWGSYWSWDPKETWALITWLVFAAYLHARITRSWQGRRPAILAAIGFLVVWICYLGVNILGKGLHSYGWFF